MNAPTCCPSCCRSDSPVVHTQILGWECRACRRARQGSATDPKVIRGQAAVDARRVSP